MTSPRPELDGLSETDGGIQKDDVKKNADDSTPRVDKVSLSGCCSICHQQMSLDILRRTTVVFSAMHSTQPAWSLDIKLRLH